SANTATSPTYTLSLHDALPISLLKPLLYEAWEQAEKASETKQRVTGLETGFIQLDDMTSGLQASDLIIVAGRPSMGKTSFALNRSEEHTSELQSRFDLVCRLLL